MLFSRQSRGRNRMWPNSLAKSLPRSFVFFSLQSTTENKEAECTCHPRHFTRGLVSGTWLSFNLVRGDCTSSKRDLRIKRYHIICVTRTDMTEQVASITCSHRGLIFSQDWSGLWRGRIYIDHDASNKVMVSSTKPKDRSHHSTSFP
jgi:hypothetical protein